VLNELGIDHEVVLYLKTPPSAEELRDIIAKLEDAPTDLVRRDAVFTKLGLTDADVATAEQVIAVLTKTPKLLQRPLLVSDTRAFIGRPKDRVRTLAE
jgi:arsenate reductase (glutaredoxin)